MTAQTFDVATEQAKRTTAARNAIEHGLFEIDQLDADTWLVKNGDGGPYTIQRASEIWACDCPDFTTRGGKHGICCKHIEGVKLWLDKDEAPAAAPTSAVAVGPSVVIEYKHTTQHDGDFFSFGLQPNIPLNPDGTLNFALASRIIGSGIDAYALVQAQVESLLKAKIAERVVAKQLHQLLQPVYAELRKLGVPPADTDEALRFFGGRPDTPDKTAADILLAKLKTVGDFPPEGWRWVAPVKPKVKTGPLNPAQVPPSTPPDEPQRSHAEPYAESPAGEYGLVPDQPRPGQPAAPSSIDQAKCVLLHLTPKNAAFQGKTLGELLGSEEGRAVIKYLAETWKPKNGGTEQDQRLKAAAGLLHANP